NCYHNRTSEQRQQPSPHRQIGHKLSHSKKMPPRDAIAIGITTVLVVMLVLAMPQPLSEDDAWQALMRFVLVQVALWLDIDMWHLIL
ncbi:hypothetical protein LTR56_016868, partial [Elasticomyces elasticus]